MIPQTSKISKQKGSKFVVRARAGQQSPKIRILKIGGEGKNVISPRNRGVVRKTIIPGVC